MIFFDLLYDLSLLAQGSIDKRRESAEKLKSAKDLEKKKEKKKNLA